MAKLIWDETVGNTDILIKCMFLIEYIVECLLCY